MSRTRLLIVALLAVALPALFLVAPTQASSERAAKKPVRPKVGQCRTTTFNQGFANADPRKPVPCSKPHRMKTFAVVSVPKKISLTKKKDRQTLSTFIIATCQPRFLKALGGSYALRDQTSYTWWSFLPTKAEQKKGARWLRCDLSILGAVPGAGSYLQPVPNVSFPMIGTRPITDTTRRCLANAGNTYWTTCNRPHVARADQTFTISSTALPSQATIKAQGATHCPDKRLTWPSSYEWRRGDHVIVCYSVTTS
jgi:hypothetical protein